jgi:hypothetical protein
LNIALELSTRQLAAAWRPRHARVSDTTSASDDGADLEGRGFTRLEREQERCPSAVESIRRAAPADARPSLDPVETAIPHQILVRSA